MGCEEHATLDDGEFDSETSEQSHRRRRTHHVQLSTFGGGSCCRLEPFSSSMCVTSEPLAYKPPRGKPCFTNLLRVCLFLVLGSPPESNTPLQQFLPSTTCRQRGRSQRKPYHEAGLQCSEQLVVEVKCLPPT